MNIEIIVLGSEIIIINGERYLQMKLGIIHDRANVNNSENKIVLVHLETGESELSSEIVDENEGKLIPAMGEDYEDHY